MQDELVTVATSWSVSEAHLIRLRLEDAGIQAYLDNQAMTENIWQLSNAIGGIKVRVASADLQRAMELLGEGPLSGDLSSDGGEFAEESESDEETAEGTTSAEAEAGLPREKKTQFARSARQ